ncbi:MAG: zf-HC2 domain-containing protein, partial [Candidatus Gastranaerophilaceae bacterium]
MKTYICQDILNLLPLYIEGKTSEETSFSIEKHLNDCDDCFNKY